jgi:hypothetical protein
MAFRFGVVQATQPLDPKMHPEPEWTRPTTTPPVWYLFVTHPLGQSAKAHHRQRRTFMRSRAAYSDGHLALKT